MTFAYGTQAELLYSMPAPGAAISAPGAASVILSGNTAVNPPFLMPALGSLWSPSQIPGKALGIRARGGLGSAATPGTFNIGIGLNTTQATKPPAIVLASSGTITPTASQTLNMFELDFEVTFTAAGDIAGAGALVSAQAGGEFTFGHDNSAPAGDNGFMLGTLAPITTIRYDIQYWIEAYATFSTGVASDTLQLTQFLVFGLN
jgi:hypothetical protein